ncbi:MAG: transcriptional repressor [Deltaproteobacteria bacterium]|jgi:Fur family peroxide stress response transcriptional regulator|nr:transcriptional repressor [Deltaproteobacteria bacterium]
MRHCNTSVEETLRAHGLKASCQRVAILRYLRETTAHPTADKVYAQLAREDESLSRATVYNTLNTLKEHGLVQEINIQKKQCRYDGDMAEHAHFCCIQCGEVTDLPLDTDAPLFTLGGDFYVESVKVFIYGRCPRCHQFSEHGE